MTGGPSFQVIFEDRHVIVVDKAAHVLTVPTPRGERNTLVHLLERYLERRGPRFRSPNARGAGPFADDRDHRGSRRPSREDRPERFSNRGSHRERRGSSDRDAYQGARPRRGHAVEVVHRLDRDTSGLLVFAKDPGTGDALRDQFREHSVERVYLAIVSGRMKDDGGTFDSYLATNKGLERYSTRGGGEAGERAITHFRVRSRGANTTVVEVTLETGRRNQIRVHFAEAGHPVLGDPRYGSKRAAHPQWPENRLALHAAVLGLVHPATGEPMRWESPMPAVFRAFISKQIRSRDDGET